MSVSIESGAPGWAWLAALALTCAFFWHLRRSGAGAWLLALRGLAVFGILAALLQPSLARLSPVLEKPRLAIVIDHGHSMRSKADGALTRLEAARAWLKRHRGLIESRAEPTLYAAAARGRRLSGFDELPGLAAASAALQAQAALRDLRDDAASAPPERVWLLSDGNADAGAGPEAAAQAAGAPVDVIGVGPARRGKGLSLTELRAPDFAFLHGRFELNTSLEASGLAGRALALRLLREERGGKGWTELSSRSIAVGSDYETVSATFSATASSLGSERYRLEAAAGEVAARRELRVEVIRQKYRIMYLAGRPSAEYAHLREFLKSDPNHELVSFVILRYKENPAFSVNELSLIPFPAEEIFVQSISQFDLFILENFSYRSFNLPPAYLSSIRNFVANGGALLVVGGENAFSSGGYRGTPLEELLPVSLSPQADDFTVGLYSPRPLLLSHPLVRLYDTPEASEAAWKALPPLDGYAQFANVRPGSTILAVHPTARTAAGEPQPVLALREFGRGKVMLVASDSTWRWRLGAAADWRIGAFYGRFWSRAVQYLTGSLDLSKVKFAPLPDRLPPREPASFALRVFDESFRPAERAATELSVLWTTPDGKTRELLAQPAEPGRWTVELTGLAAGTHRLRASARYRGRPWGEDEARFGWEASGGQSPMDRRWLKSVADAGHGAFAELNGADAGALLDKLPPPREQSVVRRRYRPWSGPWWLCLTALAWALEWAMRRMRGLP